MKTKLYILSIFYFVCINKFSNVLSQGSSATDIDGYIDYLIAHPEGLVQVVLKKEGINQRGSNIRIDNGSATYGYFTLPEDVNKKIMIATLMQAKAMDSLVSIHLREHNDPDH